jgi:L-tartrate/succinate antiporter
MRVAPQPGLEPAGCLRPAWWRVAVPLTGGLVIALLPAPAGLTQSAWSYVAVFTTVILGLITEPMPPSAVAFIGVTFAAITGLPFTAAERADPDFRLPAQAARWALTGFSNGTVWLIFAAFIFAMGYEKTGLGRRIALVMVRTLGHRTLGLGYAVAFSDALLAPFTPSNTARSAGTIYPVIRSIPELYGSRPGASARKLGAYLMWVAFATTCVTSSMFVTALAPNLLLLDLARETAGVEVTWGQWLVGFLPVGALLLLTLPWLVYRIYPPEIRTSHEAPHWAGQALVEMGPVTRREVVMATLAVVTLLLWIFGGTLIDATLVAMVGVSLMLVCGVVSWDDVIRNTSAWNVLVWFATLVVLADGLNRVGFITWLGHATADLLAGYPPLVVMLSLVTLFFLIHYMFAGITAHATALAPVVLAAGLAVDGMPVRAFVMLLGFSLGIMGVLTPYATGPAPLYYECGFIERKDFWRLGFVFGMLFLVTLLAIGTPWLRLVGF